MCHACEAKADTTFCNECGKLGYFKALTYASNGDGPNCPDCTDLLNSDILAAEEADDFSAIDRWADPQYDPYSLPNDFWDQAALIDEGEDDENND